MGEFIKRAKEARKKGLKSLPPDEAFQLEYPAVWEYLTTTTDEQGKARKPATLTAFVDAGSFKVALNDRQDGCSAFFSADAFLDALRGLEGQLQDGTAEWRRWSQTQGKGR